MSKRTMKAIRTLRESDFNDPEMWAGILECMGASPTADEVEVAIAMWPTPNKEPRRKREDIRLDGRPFGRRKSYDEIRNEREALGRSCTRRTRR